MTHICGCKFTIIGSDNGLAPGRRQAIIWTNAGILLIWPLGTNCCEIVIEIQPFPLKRMHLKMPSAKWRPICLGHYLNQRWNIVNMTLRNKLAWSINRKATIFIDENASENVVCEMAAILSRAQCVRDSYLAISSAFHNLVDKINILSCIGL